MKKSRLAKSRPPLHPALTGKLISFAGTPRRRQKRLVEAGLGIALLSESNAAEELQHASIATIGVRDLKASHDVVTITRRGGFLSAASRRLLEISRFPDAQLRI